MRNYINDDFMDDRSFLFRAMRAPVHESIESHTHDFFELVFVVNGSGQHEYKNRYSTVTEGDVYMIAPRETHGYRVESGSPLLVYNVIFQPSIIAEELEVMSKYTPFIDFFYVEPFLRKTAHFLPHLNVKGKDRIELKQLIEKLIEEDEKREVGYQLFVKTLIIQLLLFLSRCYDRMRRNPPFLLHDESKMFANILDFIALHYAQPLSLSQMSQLCGMSQSSFTAKFKQYTGLTFIEYRNDIRVGVAKELLAKTDDKTVVIALEVGFEDLSHFNKIFRSYCGVTPGQYRKSVRA